MNKIDINKKYRTACGYKAEILKTDVERPEFPILALISHACGEQRAHAYTEYGYAFSNAFSDGSMVDLTLIEIPPYEDFKIDEPVMVRANNTSCWQRRHFAGVAPNGKAKTWDGGRTTWTAEANGLIGDDFIWSAWSQCRRPTPEELA